MSALELWLMLEKVVVGEIGDWGGLETEGRLTDSHDMLDSVGDIVRWAGGRTLSDDLGCRIAGLVSYTACYEV
jgi:hypothetical protein